MAQKEKWNQKLFRIVKEEGMRTAAIKGKNYIKLRLSGDPIYKWLLFTTSKSI